MDNEHNTHTYTNFDVEFWWEQFWKFGNKSKKMKPFPLNLDKLIQKP